MNNLTTASKHDDNLPSSVQARSPCAAREATRSALISISEIGPPLDRKSELCRKWRRALPREEELIRNPVGIVTPKRLRQRDRKNASIQLCVERGETLRECHTRERALFFLFFFFFFGFSKVRQRKPPNLIPRASIALHRVYI